jgi:hypothetical protein
MKRADYFAEQLATYHEGRVILVVENPHGCEIYDYEYWMQRSDFYKAKGESLGNERLQSGKQISHTRETP